MKKWIRFVLLFVLASFSSAAWGAIPQDALSAPDEKSVYAVFNMTDVGGFARYLLSPSNVDLFMPFMDEETAQVVRLAAGIVAQLPSQELSLLAGTDANQKPFLQFAVALPSTSQPKLELVASGKAVPEDIVTLLMGEGALLMAAAFRPEVLQAPFGAYYLIEGEMAMTARENLVLFALSPEDLARSVAALERSEKRLALKRRYDSRDFFCLHLDFPTLIDMTKAQQAAAAEAAKKEGKQAPAPDDFDIEALRSMFKAPMDMEYDFRTTSDLFRVSIGLNAQEALAPEYVERLKAMKPVPGGYLHLAGPGRPLLALGGQISLKASDVKSSGMLAQYWDKAMNRLAKLDLTEADVEDLLSGSLSLVVGGAATMRDAKIPGLYLAASGRNGAAAKFLNRVMEDEAFSKSVTVAPVQLDGWDWLFKVDPALTPVPVLFGVRGETLFVGISDPTTLNAAPELTPEVEALLSKSTISTSFLDADAIWSWLRREIKDTRSALTPLLAMVPPMILNAVGTVLEGEPSVPFVSVYALDAEESFADFSLADVSPDKRILPRIVKVSSEFQRMDESPEASDSLTLLSVAKTMVESGLQKDPKADLSEMAKGFADHVVFREKDGVVYLGIQTDASSRGKLVAEAATLGLLGSAGADMLPVSPYSGQEFAWFTVKR